MMMIMMIMIVVVISVTIACMYKNSIYAMYIGDGDSNDDHIL